MYKVEYSGDSETWRAFGASVGYGGILFQSPGEAWPVYQYVRTRYRRDTCSAVRIVDEEGAVVIAAPVVNATPA